MKRVLLLLCSIPLVTIACSGPAEDSEPLVRSVRYVVVQSRDASGVRVFSGALEAGNESRLSFQVSGRVQKLPIREGQRVKKGQLVAELDPTDFRLQLGEARAEAAQARATAANAQATYQRTRRLYETLNTSRQDLDSARADRDTSRAALAAAYDAVKRIERQLGYTRLEAPAAGTINEVSVDTNEVVSEGMTIAVLQAGESLEAAVDVPEAFVRLIELGDPAKVMVGAVEAEVDGVIQEIGVSSGSGVFPIRVRLSSAPESARPGMVTEVRIEPKKGAVEPPKGFLVPLTAIGEDREGRHAFLVEGNPGEKGQVIRVPIETGTITGGGIYVTKGIEEGQRIVIAGVSRIRSGLTVKIPEKPEEINP